MQSLTYTVDSMKWGTQDTRDAMLGRALSYLVLFSTLGIILRWSYGIQLLSTADDEAPPDPKERPILVTDREAPNNTASTTHGEVNHDISAPLLEEDEENGGAENGNGNGDSKPKSLRIKASTPRFSEGPVTVNRPPNIRRRAPERRWTALGPKGDIGDVEYFGRNLTTAERNRLFRQEFSNFRSFPNTPTRTPAASSYASSAAASDSEDEEDDDDDLNSDGEYDGIGRRNGTKPSRTRWQAKFRKNKRNCMAWCRTRIGQPLGRFWKGFNNFMTAPLYAALLSLVVGEPSLLLVCGILT